MIPGTLPIATPDLDNDALVQQHSNGHRWVLSLLLIVGLLLMFETQFAIFRNPPDDVIHPNVAMMVICALILVVWLHKTLLFQMPSTPLKRGKPGRLRISAFWLPLAGILVIFESWRTIMMPGEAYLSEYLLVSFLVILSLIMAVRPGQFDTPIGDDHPLLRREYGLLILLFLGALAVRGINLGGMPYMMDAEEANFALEGADLSRYGLEVSPFGPGTQSNPHIYMETIGVAVSVLGSTLAAARLPSALIGALTIPALYLLGRELFDWRIGLVAALFALPWAYHILFSRQSMNTVCDTLFATLAFYFLVRGLRRRSATDYVFSGINFGLSQMFYVIGRLSAVAAVCYLVYFTLRRRNVVLTQWYRLLLVPIAALIFTLPHNFYLVHYHEELSTRLDKSILLNGELQDKANRGAEVFREYLTDQVRLAFGGLLTYADRSGWYGLGSNVMGPLGGPLLVIGALVSLLLLWKKPEYSLPLGWSFTIILGGGVLGISPPEYGRYMPGVSAYAPLVAIGAAAVAMGLARVLQHPEWRNRIMLGIGAALLIGNLAFFLFDYVPAKGYLANRGNWLTNRVANEIVPAYDAGRQIIMFGGWQSDVQDTAVIKYLMTGKPYTYAELDVTPQDILIPFRFDLHKPITFIVASQRLSDLTKITTMLPGGTLSAGRLQEDGTTVFFRYDVDGLPAITLQP